MPHRPVTSGVMRTDSVDASSAASASSTMSTPTSASRILQSMSQQQQQQQQPTQYFVGGNGPSTAFRHHAHAALAQHQHQHQQQVHRMHQNQFPRNDTTAMAMHHQGVVTPIMNRLAPSVRQSASWTNAPPPPLTSAVRDDDQTVTSQDRRETVASALLMVSNAAVREMAAKNKRASPTEAGPLKKRMKHMMAQSNSSQEDDVGMSSTSTDSQEQEQQQQEDKKASQQQQQDPTKEEPKPQQPQPDSTKSVPQQPFHVSPVSNGSVGSHHQLQHLRTQASSARTNSYDSKESAFSEPPPAHVVVPHFPSVLHRVLSDPEYASKVVDWCEDGESWKVMRWDALRRKVLPIYFADLRDEDGRGCGTIDAFLYHLTAWGFEEVDADGNVGAYRHELFIRGAQKLCSKMRFTAGDRTPTKAPKTVSPSRSVNTSQQVDHSMLQVPSLARQEKGNVTPNAANGVINLHSRYPTPSAPVPQHHHMSHHPAMGVPSPATPPYMHHNWNMRQQTPVMHQDWHSYGGYPQQPYHQARAPYSPPRVRSCRGSARLGAVPRPTATAAASTPEQPRSFPISNRGKSRRVSGVTTRTESPPPQPSPHQIGASVTKHIQDEDVVKSTAV